MRIKETCKQRRTVDNVTQIAALLVEMPKTEWEDVLDYIYFLKWWKAKEEEARKKGEYL